MGLFLTIPSYYAIIYITFSKAHNEYDFLWLDNTSNAGLSNGIIACAKKEPNLLALLFKFNGHNYFYTTLSYNAAHSSRSWVMTGGENGKTEHFADATMFKSS